MRLTTTKVKTVLLVLLPASVLAQPSMAPQTLPEVTVTTERISDYVADTVSVATKSDTPILDIPLSVQAVPRAVIEDQDARNLSEILKNVSSVHVNAVGSMGVDNPTVRGFLVNQQVWLDGMRLCCANFDIDNLETAEVLKGPAGILYGRVEPGGLINMVIKKPRAKTLRTIEASVGAWGWRKFSADLSGSLNQARSLQYRLNTTSLNTHSFIDNDWNQRVLIAPSLHYRLSSETSFDLQYAYKHDRGSYIDGTQSRAVNGNLVDLPYGLNLNGPDSTDELKEQRLRLDGAHQLSQRWKLNLRLMFSQAQNHARKISPLLLMPDGHTVLRNATSNNSKRRTVGINADMTGAFQAMGLSHRLLTGIDYYQFHAAAGDYAYFSPLPSSLIPSIDLYAPVHRAIDYGSLMTAANKMYSKVNQQTAGLYAQDQISSGDRWHWLLGARYDFTRAAMLGPSADPITDAAENRARRSNRAFSPSIGALYKLRTDLSLYVSHARSIALYDGSKSATGELFPPTRSVQTELGVKYMGPLAISLAVYDLEKNNVPTPDPDPTLAIQGYKVLTGQIRGRGMELDLSGDLTKRWSVHASFSRHNTIVTQANGGFIGKRVPAVARSQASLWSKFRYGSQALHHWDLGIGLFAAGATETSTQNTGVKLPGYAYVNAMAARTWNENGRRFRLALNIDNLFDRRYYINGISDGSGNGLIYLLPGSPRSLRISLQSSF